MARLKLSRDNQVLLDTLALRVACDMFTHSLLRLTMPHTQNARFVMRGAVYEPT